jgi:hypothetical protein
MSHISIGSAVGSGFGLIGRKPLTVLGWGLVRLLFSIGVFALFGPVLLGAIGPLMQAAQSAQASGSDPSQALGQAWISQMAGLQGFSLLVQIGGLFIAAVVYCAVSRSIVHPQRSSFAYLRVGAPELIVTLLSYGAGIAFVIAFFLCAIPFGIVIAILALNKMAAAAVIVGVLGALVLLVALIYVLLRFAFVIPMMVDDGQFHLFDAWTLTKGHVGALFAIGVCLTLIGLVGELVVGAVFIALGATALSLAAGGFGNLQAFFNLPPITIFTRLGPWLAAYALLAIPLEGCVMAIFMAPWAQAYRDVTPPSVASVFEGAPPAAPTPPEPPIAPSPAQA